MLDGDYIIASRWVFRWLETKQQLPLKKKYLNEIAAEAEVKEDEYSPRRIKNYLNGLLSESYLEWASLNYDGRKEWMRKQRSEVSLKPTGMSDPPAEKGSAPGTTGQTLML